jgi:hypothetical protein
MSRARNIKPGFFKNELLVELAFEYRLLFVGLWTMADRDGRLEDRPTKIRMEVFPADPVDVSAGLQALHDGGFILRYTVDGKAFIQILAWCKHQNPHVKEAKSTIPAPGEHCASTVQDTTKADTSPADSLIPDSLIPDSLQDQETPIPPSRGQAVEGKPKRAKSPKGMTYADFVQACRTDGEKLIPLEHAVFAFAATAGIPTDFLELAWREFVRQYRDGKTTQAGKRGWRQKFENCVRRNWFRLWWMPGDGQCDLTTAGVQLKRERDAERAPKEDQAA